VYASAAAASTAARSAPVAAVTTAATAPSTNGASTSRVFPGSSSPSASSVFTVSTALPRSVSTATPAPRSTDAAAAAMSSALVPSPPPSVPPAGATGTASPAPASPFASSATDAATAALCETSTMPTVPSLTVGLRPRRGRPPGREPERRRRRPRVLVSDAALAEIAGPALVRLHRRRRDGGLLGGAAGRREGRTERVHRRHQRVDHGLVAGCGTAELPHRVHPGAQRLGQLLFVHLGGVAQRLPGPAQQRAVQRAGGAAHLRDEQPARQGQHGAGRGGRFLLQRVPHRREPAPQVPAVVGVPDG